jgi:hypothetical protein
LIKLLGFVLQGFWSDGVVDFLEYQMPNSDRFALAQALPSCRQGRSGRFGQYRVGILEYWNNGLWDTGMLD